MQSKDLEYNYVIVGSSGYYLVGYHDVINRPDVSYHKDYNTGFNSRFQRNIVRWNFSRVVNKFIDTPFKHYVFPRLFPFNFTNKKPLCFLFFANQLYLYKPAYIKYLKDKFPSARFVLYYQDLLSTYKKLDIEAERHLFDLIISYDYGDSEKYGIEFHPTPMSVVSVVENSSIEESDVYFCGYAKSRYRVVHQLYKQLTDSGLKCDFNLLHMPEGAERLEGINYITKGFDYMLNLQHVLKSKCILEVMQDGADGFTPRLWESIVYNRHLLTNNKLLFSSSFFQEKSMHMIGSEDCSNIRSWINEPITSEPSLVERLSPHYLLSFVESKL